MSLYVGNLHPDCNEAILYKKFSLEGKVSSVKICRDSATANSLGYGYVNFSDVEEAKKAMEAINYDIILGKAMRIMWAQNKPSLLSKSANLVVKNLDTRVDEISLKNTFSAFGDILSVKVAKTSRGDSKGYGFVQFADDEAAEWAIASFNEQLFNGRKLEISRFIPVEERRRFQQSMFPNNICVSNLTTTSSEELTKICEAFGDVLSSKIVTDANSRSRRFGFVSFKEREGAEKAVQELNRLCLNGKHVVASFVKAR